MASPAERYEAALARVREAPRFQAFRDAYEFGLDEFQVQACQGLERGRSVLVAAPTGAGKTVVGEFAIHLALAEGRKCFYTTPIKALSNQKYRDLVARHGESAVGLLTGDSAINGEAPIVVMTTEVLRNMLYASSATLRDLGYVVMDEVHYLADRFRGAVWEEVIIHLPASVTLVALSATVSNAEEFGAWLEEVRGDTLVVVDEHRPVPLWQHVMADRRMLDLFVDDEQQVVNPELVRLERQDELAQRSGGRPQRGGRRPRSPNVPWRTEVVAALERDDLLPAIYFIFSRAGCDEAVQHCLRAGLHLASESERKEIRKIAMAATVALSEDDLAALRFDEWLEGLERGIAAHHAGMLPVFKEVVEELFQAGLLKVVFATETLALGINMPARAVALEKLVKWNGEAHVALTPGEYTQLTGRAGRRGIDVEGHAVVVWHAGIDPRALAGLASTRTYPLNSSFRPSYNMAVNLVSQMGRHSAREVLETSFAQFQADRSVVSLATQIKRLEEAVVGYEAAMACHLGDIHEYAALRERIGMLEKRASRDAAVLRRTEAADSLRALRAGDIIWIPAGRRAGPAVVVDPAAAADEPRPLVLTAERQVRRISTVELDGPIVPVGRMRVPKSFAARSPQARRDLAAALRTATTGLHPQRSRKSGQQDEEIPVLRAQLRAHPCHGCDEREAHARWAERAARTRREIADLERRVEGRTNSIARHFDRVCEVLAELAYLTSAGDDAEVTPDGRLLMRLYTECDLLTAECLRTGAWSQLRPAELAAVCSALVYESRSAEEEQPPRLPRGAVQAAADALLETWSQLHGIEGRHGLAATRRPDLGFAWAAYRWAQGASLGQVLEREEMTAGDFVRWMRQVVDLLGQIADAGDEQVRASALEAIGLLQRGVVAAQLAEA